MSCSVRLQFKIVTLVHNYTNDCYQYAFKTDIKFCSRKIIYVTLNILPRNQTNSVTQNTIH